MFQNIARRVASFRTYRRTVSELNSLNDRELADLGISRGEIGALAVEAAYGK